MLHICMTKKGEFFFATIENKTCSNRSDNFESKQSVVDFMAEQMKETCKLDCTFQDDTIETPKVYLLLQSGCYYPSDVPVADAYDNKNQ